MDSSGGIDAFAGWTALGDWVPGENRILVLSLPGDLMQSVTITSVFGMESFGGIDQLKQTEISGLTPVPEPATLLLLGFGLVAVTATSRKALRH